MINLKHLKKINSIKNYADNIHAEVKKLYNNEKKKKKRGAKMVDTKKMSKTEKLSIAKDLLNDDEVIQATKELQAQQKKENALSRQHHNYIMRTYRTCIYEISENSKKIADFCDKAILIHKLSFNNNSEKVKLNNAYVVTTLIEKINAQQLEELKKVANLRDNTITKEVLAKVLHKR